ncbi:hypothetical protein I7I51_03076 [Histoplasma capsulatum]|uniref:Uncharacterized protein n=1 Tax=Ajellomyces capsulatus TaxID=5037 RepID=A0A8A1MQ20_AJECA|nr:hypothetical protein I7I51_03076 [Histoplasma capsulatum]
MAGHDDDDDDEDDDNGQTNNHLQPQAAPQARDAVKLRGDEREEQQSSTSKQQSSIPMGPSPGFLVFLCPLPLPLPLPLLLLLLLPRTLPRTPPPLLDPINTAFSLLQPPTSANLSAGRVNYLSPIGTLSSSLFLPHRIDARTTRGFSTTTGPGPAEYSRRIIDKLIIRSRSRS